MTFSSVEDASRFFEGDRFAMTNGIVIDSVENECAICSMDICENHLNANGTVMGGVYFTLADFAAAVAANNVYQISVTLDSNITYLAPAKGKKLIATARVVRSGKSTTFCEVNVTDEQARICAVLTANAFKLH